MIKMGSASWSENSPSHSMFIRASFELGRAIAAFRRKNPRICSNHLARPMHVNVTTKQFRFHWQRGVQRVV